MPKPHLKQPGFTYRTCGPFNKHRERIQKLIETGDLKHLDRNESDKACFAQDTGYSGSKDLARITISDKILKGKAYKIDRNRKYEVYQRALGSMVYQMINNDQ